MILLLEYLVFLHKFEESHRKKGCLDSRIWAFQVPRQKSSTSSPKPFIKALSSDSQRSQQKVRDVGKGKQRGMSRKILLEKLKFS